MIGIYGGTFNPVHYGHLRTALEVKEIFRLDELRLLPCKLPPHRDEPEVSADMRWRMLQLASDGVPGMLVDRRELDRAGRSYMVDTLASLRGDFPATPMLLFVGTDAFAKLNTWHRWQDLFNYAHVVVMTRPGFRHESLNEFFRSRLLENAGQLSASLHGKLCFQSVTQLDISATAIRQIITSHRDPRFLLPDSVINFINQQQLYRG